MHECTVRYEDCLDNKHHNNPTNPFGAYFAQRGARVTYNVFYDTTLILGDSVFNNLLMIIKSGRKQKFEKIKLVLPPVLIKYTTKVAYQLMVLEQVVIVEDKEDENVIFSIYYPEELWLKGSFRNAQQRTSLHPKHIDKESLLQVKRCCELPERSASDVELLIKSLDLDE